jgi:hypothetical protein
MGTIIERTRKDGSVAYLAQILVMRDSKIAHRESKTFDRRPAASTWIKKRKAELAKPGAAPGYSACRHRLGTSVVGVTEARRPHTSYRRQMCQMVLAGENSRGKANFGLIDGIAR